MKYYESTEHLFVYLTMAESIAFSERKKKSQAQIPFKLKKSQAQIPFKFLISEYVPVYFLSVIQFILAIQSSRIGD